jgi:serine/threonine-protein kinase PRP4
VLLCKTAIDGEEKTVAVKLIRANDTMRDAAQVEVRLLTELQEGQKSKFVIRLLTSFEYRNHAALVFEPMQMNVREAMKKFGGRDGLSLKGVKVFCKQLLLGLNHLKKCHIVHAGTYVPS